MKASKLGLAAIVAVTAVVMSACGNNNDSGGSASGDHKDIKICMYTHGDGGGFWSVAKKGAEQAADDLGVTLDYQETNNDPAKQAQLIEAGTTAGCDAMAVSAPNPDAIKDALSKATAAGIPFVFGSSGRSM